jgi:hypothetical protein
MEIIWTRHAGERQWEWGRRLGITRQEVEAMLRHPEQVVPGDRDIRVAQARRGQGLMRVPFLDVGGDRRILTVYWTSKVEKYWKEGRGG